MDWFVPVILQRDHPSQAQDMPTFQDSILVTNDPDSWLMMQQQLLGRSSDWVVVLFDNEACNSSQIHELIQIGCRTERLWPLDEFMQLQSALEWMQVNERIKHTYLGKSISFANLIQSGEREIEQALEFSELAIVCAFMQERLEDVESTLHNAMTIKQDDMSMLMLSTLYGRQYRYAEALNCTRQILQSEVLRLSFTRLPTYRIWELHGVWLAREGKIEEASAAFQQALQARLKEEEAGIQGLRLNFLQVLQTWVEELTSTDLEFQTQMWTEIEQYVLAIMPSGHQMYMELREYAGEPYLFDNSILLTTSMQSNLQHLLTLIEQNAPFTLAGGTSMSELQVIIMMEYAVSEGYMKLAERLQGQVEDPNVYAKILFQRGYLLLSADLLIAGLQNQSLDLQCYRYLGEILYKRGVYEEAASFFGYLHLQPPYQEDAQVHTALILANMRQSEKLLADSSQLFATSLFLQEELVKVRSAIKRLEQTDAMTKWSAKERKRFHVQIEA
ncbi:hypothetical protein NV379_05260 [Paenibacillus sp. N1-5-1-14]|uniref:hypothetical protein n=1 Tax=Paenibacillus radicibacter TaxID=2972488 RepID=UPI00215944DD|nr:hypothetical protein [Paenibacillus radicibacter]MCR8642060.1 hypothetical protein [Paenibacillus radicibacter]